MAIVKTHLGNIKGPQGIQGIQGPQGDPFKYEDFTPEQLEDIVHRVARDALDTASICYVSTAVPASEVGKDGDICVVTDGVIA